MRDHHPDPAVDLPARAGGTQLRRRPARLALLLACLVALAAYLLLSRVLNTSPTAAACPSGEAGEVVRVAPSGLSALRAAVMGVMPQRLGRLYEEGTVLAANAWSDNEPSPPPLSPTAPRPAAYEMRWWAPNRDDIVADVFVFANARAAQRFMQRAVSTRCRASAQHEPAPRPAQAHNLAWINPEGHPQADVFINRGARVYRVADVPSAAVASKPTIARLGRAFYTIDTLACLLPDAGCARAARSLPV